MRKLIKWLVAAMIIGVTVWSFTPVQLSVPQQYQLPNLPNGCEAVSLAMVSSFYGQDVNGERIVNDFLPKGPIGKTSPRKAYVGDPYGSGYYCYPRPLAEAGNAYFKESGSALQAKAPLFMDWYRISWSLHTGHPVICWVTIDGKLPEKQDTVTWDINGRQVHPYKNLHVVVVTGVSAGTVHVNDPTDGEKKIPWHEFMMMYISMGLKSVVVT